MTSPNPSPASSEGASGAGGRVGAVLTEMIPQQPPSALSAPSGAGSDDTLGIIVVDERLTVLEADLAGTWLDGVVDGSGTRATDLFPPDDAAAIAARVERVLATGRPLLARVQRMIRPDGTPAVVSLSVLPAAPGRVVISLIDVSAQLDVFAASSTLGTSLEIETTARQLAEGLLPWGDAVTVSLAQCLWSGDLPDRTEPQCRAAYARAGKRPWPRGFLRLGERLPDLPAHPTPDTTGHPGVTVLPDRAAIERALGDDPDLIRALVPDHGPLAVAFAPLTVPDADRRQRVLGTVAVWRRADNPRGAFDGDDQLAVQELAFRAAMNLEHGRRHQREHRQVLALQRRLRPPHSPSRAMHTAGAYRPAAPDSAGLGGDWMDVIGLSGGRIALVIGDAVGHGLAAAAVMGTLRQAAQTLAAADHPPVEVMAHLDTLVGSLHATAETDGELGAAAAALGTTCCYAVYDPAVRRLTVVSAGHLPPVLVHPDGAAELLAPPLHPPLGTAREEPYEALEVTAEPGTLIGLYTDGLVEHPGRDLDDGMTALLEALSWHYATGDLGTVVGPVVDHVTGPPPQHDDLTLLLARMDGLPAADMPALCLPAGDLTAVARARAWTRARVAEWGLADPHGRGALVVSELVTNALRFGTGGPVTLRLLHLSDRLICEVTGLSHGRPRARRPAVSETGGRGLLVVQHTSAAWGTRLGETAGERTVWAQLTVASGQL
ncbi:ATP-binding SpoIIE family protein phosphatase [Streptomyces sp. CBMA29]|uniref:ATP-binding SpoIIE family protein phosphatase n=1 Tax=Streptomyces sp. CBMA29 TaxID=1896314 RepID=UPI001661F812|nr:ATP-binding SpoIIE family protein phosphatase [Streptomyces sp. CBMA29]